MSATPHSIVFTPTMLFFLILHDFGLLRNVLEFSRDNERVILSHTCMHLRAAIVEWIPTKARYRTLTPPQILPDLFVEKNGVFSIDIPKTSVDFNFTVSMLGQTDIHDKGVKALRWFEFVTGVGPTMDTRRMLMMSFLSRSQSLAERHMVVLKRRLEENRDEGILVQDMRHWDFVKDMLKTNSSINRFVFFNPHSDTFCYASVFDFLGQRENKTEYLDISGNISLAARQAFNLLAWNLTGIMLRDLSCSVMSSMLGTIISSPNDASLTCLQFDHVHLDLSVENPMLEIVDTLEISKMLFNTVTFEDRGFSRLISVLSNSCIRKLHFRKCELSLCETVQCLFLPTIPGIRLCELFLSGVHIREEAASALASCVESGNFLTKLSLDGTKLGPICVKMLITGLKNSSLSTLNLKGNDLGEEAHNLFLNVGMNGTLRHLYLDSCSFCQRAVKEYRWAKDVYKKKLRELYVSVAGVKLTSRCLKKKRRQ